MEILADNLDRFVEGIGATISLTVVSWLAAFVIGVTVASLRVGPIRPLRGAATVYVELVRNCPLAVLFVLFFFGLPSIGILFESKFVSAVIVLSIYTGAFVAETVRSGVNTVASGQVEAARSLGLGFSQVLGLVVLPQALRSVVAPLGNLFIALTKNSSIAYTIGFIELTGTANQIAVENAEFVTAFAAAAGAYLLLTLPSGLAVGALERRVAIRR
ncbi:MAG TPA: amino acid ABC transporter permease [Acidimicrobiales bacterium]|nr:amino acid ABC transporter permease [Acidimicrobiales bacterium]